MLNPENPEKFENRESIETIAETSNINIAKEITAANAEASDEKEKIEVIDENKTSEDEAIEAWRDFLEAFSPYLKISAEMCVKNIAKTIMLKISHYVNEENTFTMSDEKIFTRYLGLMAGYAEASSVYNERLSGIGDLRLREILSGVSDILSAQLKQYEEHINGLNGLRKNPVADEKEQIIRSVYENLLASLKTVAAGVISESGYFGKNELMNVCAEYYGKSANESHLDFFTFVYQRVIEKGGLDIYKSYSGAMMECKNTVNSLDLRKEARFFCEALKQEKENLDSIVKIQVAALAECYGNVDESEWQAVERIIAILTETRDTAEREAAELDRIFTEAESSVRIPALMNYDDFLSFIEEKGLCAYADKLRAEGLETGTLTAVLTWREKLDIFIEKFGGFVKEHTGTAADTMPYKRFLYESRLKITDKLILTDEMLAGVKELANFYENNAERLKESTPDDLMKIIEGINESIIIKIDVLLEGRKNFEEEAAKTIAGGASSELADCDTETAFSQRFGIWREEMTSEVYGWDYYAEARNRIPGIIRKINEKGCSEDYQAKMERIIGKSADKVIKLEASYLRDCLLFEIITFEEILAYSVSKLKESGNAAAIEYAGRCGMLEETFIKLCKLHNILIIAPKPYDTFNGAEHEVLVAEKTEGYKKGQIIKMMNSGFKYNEAVLVRANVIAAK